MGFRSARAEQADIGRPGNAAGDDGGGIMVAGEKEHRDFGPIQAAHGAGEIEAGAHVLPLTVEEVAAITTKSTSSSMRSEEHTSELQSLMRISYAVFCLKKKTQQQCDNQ